MTSFFVVGPLVFPLDSELDVGWAGQSALNRIRFAMTITTHIRKGRFAQTGQESS
jgi:hypothetical protein